MMEGSGVECHEVIGWLEAHGNLENLAGMARYGIDVEHALGVPMPELRRLGKRLGRDHDLALDLWASEVHEARILATLVDDPAQVNDEQMETWVVTLDSWDICDQLCNNLFRKTALAYRKAADWSDRSEEFVRRSGFVLMATLAVHDKKAGDEAFLAFLPLIEAGAVDGRNFVKKAVNWALRQIGKRNAALNQAAIGTAQQIQALHSPPARWVAADALRELRSEAVQMRLTRT
jgi:3-methyladenine DNA glycosylase AlkD